VTTGHGVGQELRRRDAILDAARFAAERFLEAAGDWRDELPEVLASFGRAAEVSRVFVSANFVDARGRLCSRPLAEWDAPGIRRAGDDAVLQGPPWTDGFGRWAELLGRNEIIVGHVRDFPVTEQAVFLPQGVVSTVVVPVFVQGEWWGHVGFDECTHERGWSDAEQAALRTAAGILGMAVRLDRTAQALRERETQYRQVFETSTDGMAITHLDGVLVRANAAFHAMHGYAPGELDGRPAEVWTAGAGCRR
jgi:GAF domain-containing protein